MKGLDIPMKHCSLGGNTKSLLRDDSPELHTALHTQILRTSSDVHLCGGEGSLIMCAPFSSRASNNLSPLTKSGVKCTKLSWVRNAFVHERLALMCRNHYHSRSVWVVKVTPHGGVP